MQHNTIAKNSELGEKSDYISKYNPEKLFAIPRAGKRLEIGITDENSLPFFGVDIWNHYEVSWLNELGKPIVAVAEIIIPCTSKNIIESKSMKLYFNTFNNTKFKDLKTLIKTIKTDIENKISSEISVKIFTPNKFNKKTIAPHFDGICIDDIDVEFSKYIVDPSFLKTNNEYVNNEILYSDLLKSNCLVTNQPDWGSVCIQYSGLKINREGLLKYIVSFRNHNEFHEQCIERIFIDISKHCAPEQLSVFGRYTRRGGLDINPFRATTEFANTIPNIRLWRQ